ncbi:MAG TPA: hypothetical protein PL098_00040 [Brevundimonas diminuta]|nr:hypothetical protein [Brevundimonas diminuta]HRL23293.1 hypothetical protein [Brevundimonas diminuta]
MSAELIARLEAAKEGSLELDDSVVIAALGGEMMDWWDEAAQQHQIKAGDGSRVNVTPVTASVDAALALAERVLPGWRWSVQQLGPNYEASLTLPNGAFLLSPDTEVYTIAKTPALALCIAILRAEVKGCRELVVKEFQHGLR